MARRRPNAFEVSFPEEAKLASPALTSLAPVSGPSEPIRSFTPLKRKSESQGLDDHLSLGDVRETKRVQLPPPAFYEDRGGELESADLLVMGEDPFVLEDRDENDDVNPPLAEKPTRELTDFSIYDTNHRNEMVLISSIEEDDGVDRQFEGAGFVSSYVELDDDDDGLEYADEAESKYIRLGKVLGYTFDYTQPNGPVHIETPFAWYILRDPSKAYQPLFRHFFTPRRIAQMIVSSSIKNPRKGYEEFFNRFIMTVDPFGRTYREEHIWDSISEIQEAVAVHEDPQRLKMAPLIRHILRKAPAEPQTRRALRPGVLAASRYRRPPMIKALFGNPDLAVLKPENQTPCHVTPLIASMVKGMVQEELIVVGSRPPPENKALKEAQRKAAHKRLCEMVGKAKQQKKVVNIKREDFVGRRTRYLRAVTVGGELFQIGDFVIVPIEFGRNGKQYVPPSHLPANVQDIATTSTIADYFWFAKILYGDIDTGMFHVQWLQHSSQTMMQELGHAQELFLNEICDHIPFGAVTSKVTVHEGSKLPPEAEYFVKFMYDAHSAAYTSIDPDRQRLATQKQPPSNCMVCPLVEQQDRDKSDYPLKDAQGVVNGVTYGGRQYHHEDFVLYRAEQGPAHIGYITGFDFRPILREDVRTQVYVRRVGRISSLTHLLPDGLLGDERHLFLTDEAETVPLGDLLRVCFVFHSMSIPNLKKWLALSPYHFFIKYSFPTMLVKSWTQHRSLSFTELIICKPCTETKLAELKDLEQFLAEGERNPLKVLDIFGGVGAYSMGLVEGSGCLQLADLVEISPSAAKTAMRNFPIATIHNQCANEILRFSIKEKSGQHPNSLKQIFDGNTIIPTLEKPDIIVAGVPCQSHSGLNMYKRANDARNNSILTALSYVDHLRPSLFYFENVPGFLGFSFDTVQSSIHKVEGGLPMGGLKFLVSALLEIGYQLRFGVLQAGHYGAPQRRQRFILVAAIEGHPLPELPEPSHAFPTNSLQIKLPIGDNIRPFMTSSGTAPHPFVTIDDAISDLPRFDWKHPRLHQQSAAKQNELRRRNRDVPSLPCQSTSTHCGYSGEVDYHHAPKTTYQASARIKRTKNLQQFTRTLLSKKVERVISIPLVANADYRDLRPDQHEWQVSNPLSSVARKKYRPGLYGRLDQTGVFPTTVTNIEPTAKQSRVLNPYCHRMVTVRELARSQGFPDHFVFEAIGHNVITMHRQIGNAVPLHVGAALGRELRAARFKFWLADRREVDQRT